MVRFGFGFLLSRQGSNNTTKPTHSSLKSLISSSQLSSLASPQPNHRPAISAPTYTHHHNNNNNNSNKNDVALSDSWDHEIYHSLCENALTKTEILDPYLAVYKYPVPLLVGWLVGSWVCFATITIIISFAE